MVGEKMCNAKYGQGSRASKAEAMSRSPLVMVIARDDDEREQ